VKKIYIVSLGCPKNLVDTETAVYKFAEKGFAITFDEEDADWVLINTCAFLNSAIKESKSAIKNYISLKKKGKIEKILVFGCLVEREKEKLLNDFPEIDGFFGVGSSDCIDDFLKGGGNYFVKKFHTIGFENRLLLTLNHSAYLKIADGCDNFCSYCAIPTIRGRFRSKKIEDVLEEAKLLVKNGVKEISLIAQDTTNYGSDIYSSPKLNNLLMKLEKIKKLKWIRLMYLYPSMIDNELLNIIKSSDKILHYIEIPIQHISNRVLKLMNRRYTSYDIYKKIDLIKGKIKDVALRSTFLVGFPGETDKDFKDLLKFLSYSKFNSLSIFKYSREKGTMSYAMKQLDSRVKNERYKTLVSLQSLIVDELNKSIIDKEFEVLFDSTDTARSYMDAPDIDGRFYISNYRGKPGEFKKIKVLNAKGYIREGVVI
jgi:ribosomal protein S12 methylthiotransferase